MTFTFGDSTSGLATSGPATSGPATSGTADLFPPRSSSDSVLEFSVASSVGSGAGSFSSTSTVGVVVGVAGLCVGSSSTCFKRWSMERSLMLSSDRRLFWSSCYKTF